MERNRTGSSSDDEVGNLVPPIESQNDPIAAESGANSSVGQKMTQSEIDGLLERVSLESISYKAERGRQESEINQRLSEISAKLSLMCNEDTKIKLQGEMQLQSELVMSTTEIISLREKIVSLTEENISLEAQLRQQQYVNADLKQKCEDLPQVKSQLTEVKSQLTEVKSQLTKAKSLHSQYFQLYNEESAKLISTEQQLECEKEKNRQKDQMLVKLQKELTEKSTEIHTKAGEILKLRQTENRPDDQQLAEVQNEMMEKSAEIYSKTEEIQNLRQTAQSLSDQLEEKSEELLLLKSQVKTALDEHLNCSICSQQMTEAVAMVECGHTFCKKCIDKWINKGNETCPFCRSESDNRSAPVVAIQQLQAKLLSFVNGDQPIVTGPNGEDSPVGSNNTSASNSESDDSSDDEFVNGEFVSGEVIAISTEGSF